MGLIVKQTAFDQILVVDDEENIRLMLKTVLEKEGWRVALSGSAAEALTALRAGSYQAMISDIRMAKTSGLELLSESLTIDPQLVVVMMSAYGSVDTAIEAMKRGAYDYIAKPFKTDEVVLVLRKAEERQRLKSENIALRSRLAEVETTGLDNMVARSVAMQRLFKTVRKIAEYKTTVLIQGESGTGKELVARALHDCSPRSDKSFVPVNCGAIPDNPLESELFGHVKGAFTDAMRDKLGLFQQADGGTLFLDEIGELPANLQVKLLRALQEEEIRPLGAETDTKVVDVRVVAATVRNLQEDVDEGLFRADLFYRLNVVPLQLPSLRQRIEDVPLLAEHFVQRVNARLGLSIAGIDPEAMRLFMDYRWPGNVRELENTIEHAVVLADGNRVSVESLPAKLREKSDPMEIVRQSGCLSIKKASRMIEEELIRRALAQTNGNRTAASKLLEISHRALLYKIKDYAI